MIINLFLFLALFGALPFRAIGAELPKGADEQPIFNKISGPAGLTVSAGGSLGGTPGLADLGTNRFTVRGTDLSNEAMLGEPGGCRSERAQPVGLARRQPGAELYPEQFRRGGQLSGL